MKKIPFLVAAAAFVLAPIARADDPPAPVKPADPAPATAKHENKVTDEAKAAYEKMEKAANCAATKGVKEVSGAISTQMPVPTGKPIDGETPPTGPMSQKFTFKAPGDFKIEAAAGGEGGGQGGGAKGGGKGQRMGRGPGGGQLAQSVMRYALGAFRPASDAEYDASVATKDGKSVLTVTTFKDGAESSHTDYALDANGLPATASVSRSSTDKSGQKRESKTDLTFTWTKAGDVHRLDKLETSMKMGENAMTTTVEISYVDAGGMSFPSSWKSQTMGGAMETHVTELVVDGKKVEIAAPKAPDKKDGEGTGDK